MVEEDGLSSTLSVHSGILVIWLEISGIAFGGHGGVNR